MKIIILTVSILLASSLSAPLFAADALKLGSVDMQKLAAQSNVGKNASKQMASLTEKYKKEITTRGKALEKLRTELEKKGSTMPADEKNAKIRNFQNKLTKYQKYIKDVDKEMRAKDEAFTKKILAAIETASKDYGQANGYSLILRKGDVLYTDGKNEIKDISEDVLKLLNQPKNASRKVTPVPATPKASSPAPAPVQAVKPATNAAPSPAPVKQL